MHPTSALRWFRGLALPCLLGSAGGTPAAWERLAPLPVPNGGFVAAAGGGRIVALGGVTWRGDEKIWLDGHWSYDPARNAWSEAGRLPASLAYATVGTDGTTVWFAGGSSGTTTHRQLWRLVPGEAPRPVAAIEPALVYAAGGLIGDTLYAVGGTDDQAAIDRVSPRFYGIDIRTGAAQRLANYPEASLTTATAAVAVGRLHVFGGARWDAGRKGVVNHASAHAFDPAVNRWEKLPPLPHPGRGFCAVALDDRHILVAGGYRNDEVEFVSAAYVFDAQRRTFTPTTPLPYAAMVSLVRSGEWIYCLGGEDRKRHRTDAAYRIRWKELLPAGR